MYLNCDFVMENVLPKLNPMKEIGRFKDQDVVYDCVLDMALTFYVPVSSDECLNILWFNQELLNALGLTKEELKNRAMSNLEKQYTVEDIETLLEKLLGHPFTELPDSKMTMLVATNRNRVNGAAVMLSNQILSEAKNKLGGKVVILPSSVHEVIIVKHSNIMTLQELYKMVCEINQEAVSPQDFLSDNIYTWSKEEGLQSLL